MIKLISTLSTIFNKLDKKSVLLYGVTPELSEWLKSNADNVTETFNVDINIKRYMKTSYDVVVVAGEKTSEQAAVFSKNCNILVFDKTDQNKLAEPVKASLTQKGFKEITLCDTKPWVTIFSKVHFDKSEFDEPKKLKVNYGTSPMNIVNVNPSGGNPPTLFYRKGKK